MSGRMTLALACGLLLTGCTSDNAKPIGEVVGYGVYRVRDETAKVTCWAHANGISCLRDEVKP